MALTSDGLINGGRTAHYQFQYEDSIADGLEPARTNEVLAACEADCDQVSGWFRQVALDVNPPIRVNVTRDGRGASRNLSAGNLTITINPGPGDAASIRHLLVSAMVDQFMRAQDLGWLAAGIEGSQGEGLSRFLGAQFLMVNGLGNPPIGFGESNAWLVSPRIDYVNNNTNPADDPDVIAGCSLLFIHYLHSQLGFSVEAIVAAGADTLAGVYRNLTEDATDPFPSFKKLLDNAFPETTAMPGANPGNPFPVPGSASLNSKWAVGTLSDSASLYLVGRDEGGGRGRAWSRVFPDSDQPAQVAGWLPLGDDVFQPGTPVTALSTGPGATGLYAIGLDGRVWSNLVSAADRPGRSRGWFPLGSNTFPKNSLVTAVSTVPGGISLYLVGRDEGGGGGRVWSRVFPDPDHPRRWTQWFPVGDNVVFRQGAPVAALSTGRGATSLYVMGLDGQVWSNFFPAVERPGQWKGWFPLGPNTFPKNAPVTAISTIPGGASLYLVGPDEGRGGGRVWSKFFPDPDHPGQWTGWFSLDDAVFQPGVSVTALSTGPGTTSLYTMGLDGRVWSNVFPDPERPGQWKGWFALGSSIFPINSTVAALSAVPGGTSLYLVGLYEGPGGGRVWSKFVPDLDPPGQWSEWLPLGDDLFPIPVVTVCRGLPGGDP